MRDSIVCTACGGGPLNRFWAQRCRVCLGPGVVNAQHTMTGRRPSIEELQIATGMAKATTQRPTLKVTTQRPTLKDRVPALPQSQPLLSCSSHHYHCVLRPYACVRTWHGVRVHCSPRRVAYGCRLRVPSRSTGLKSTPRVTLLKRLEPGHHHATRFDNHHATRLQHRHATRLQHRHAKLPCRYTNTHTHLYTRTHTYTQTCTCTFTCIAQPACTHACTHEHMHAHACAQWGGDLAGR